MCRRMPAVQEVPAVTVQKAFDTRTSFCLLDKRAPHLLMNAGVKSITKAKGKTALFGVVWFVPGWHARRIAARLSRCCKSVSPIHILTLGIPNFLVRPL